VVRRVRTYVSARPRVALGLGIAAFLTVCGVLAVVFLNPTAPAESQSIAQVILDGEAPFMERVAPVSEDGVGILFSEPIDPETLSGKDFTVSPARAVAGVRVLDDGRSVIVGLADGQEPGAAYTITVLPNSVSDLEGNVNPSGMSLRFPGFGASGGSLTVTHGDGAQRPRGRVARRPDEVVAVDQLHLKADGGDVTISTLRVRALSDGNDLFADTVNAFLFQDNGDGVFQPDGRDPQIGTEVPFAGRLPGSPAIFSGIGYTIPAGEEREVWVVFRLGNLAQPGRIIGSRIGPDDIQVSAGSVKSFTQIVSAEGGKTVYIDPSIPIMAAGKPADPTTFDVRFDHVLDPDSVRARDFTVNGKKVVSAELQEDGRTITLRTDGPVSQSESVDVNYLRKGTLTDLGGVPGVYSVLSFGPVSQTATDVTPPSTVTWSSVTTGAAYPIVANLSWNLPTDDSNFIAGYRVYRSTTATGTFRAIGGSTAVRSFADTSGIPGQPYYYRVTAYDRSANESTLSAVSNSITATWTETPHRSYSGSGNACDLCHVSHLAATKEGILRKGPGGTASEVYLCYECHDGSGASTNVRNGATESFNQTLSAGHWLEDKVDTSTVDLTNGCSDCHGPHQDANNAAKAGLWRSKINSHTVTGNNKTWCMACHDEKHSWASSYGLNQAGYDAKLRTPTLATSTVVGYPILGTYPGSDVVTNTARNPHASVQETPGAEPFSCKACHASHRGTSLYDALRYRNTPTTNTANVVSDRQTGAYAQMCLRCHDGSFAGATNIKQWVTAEYNLDDSYAGHRILSGAKSSLPTGTPLPCNGCHGAHGARNNNASSISDNLGKNLSTADAGKVRAFCLSCHATSDNYIWNSDTSATVVAGAQTFYGIPRNDQTTALRITATVPEHAQASAVSCYKCHGNDYSAPTKFNVHFPNRGESQGAMACGVCHDVITNAMKSSGSYHHYVATDTAASYPVLADPSAIAPAQRTCLTCHVDHDVFNKNINAANTQGRSRNLRASIGSAPSSATMSTYLSTDFEASTGAGVCTDCHRVSTVKSTTGRKTDNTQTVAISSTGFRFSAHNYESFSSTYSADNSRFRPNCGKCHNDTTVKEYQVGAWTYASHDSTRVAALGNTTSTPLPERPEEQYCYLCHSRANDLAGSPNNPNGGSAYTDLTAVRRTTPMVARRTPT